MHQSDGCLQIVKPKEADMFSMKKRLFTIASIATFGILLGGCAATAPDDGTISIWVDAARVPAVDALQAKYPDMKLEVNTISNTGGSSGLKQQFTLFNQSGEGWPDVIFFGALDDIAWAASDPVDYAMDVSSVMSSDYWDGYSDAAIAPCILDGATVCVRNDQAQDVLWYNKTMFDQWGYTPPTTWEEYESLSLDIADNHPGYFTGLVGDALTTARYLWPSECPTNVRVDAETVKIDLEDSSCTRVKDMLNTLVEAGVVSAGGAFDSEVADKVGPNLVMTPGATWFGNYLFRDTFKVPAGQISASLPLAWEGEQPSTGNEGGGLWVASKHVADSKLGDVETILEFMTTDSSWQVELSTGFPAHGSVQDAWLAKQAADGYFADPDTVSEVFLEAGAMVAPYSLLNYNTGDVYTRTVAAKLASGGTFAEGWEDFASELPKEAKTFGYTVATK